MRQAVPRPAHRADEPHSHGAGPTILSVVRTAEANVFFERAQAALESDEELAHFTLHRFVADNEGAKVV